MKILIVDDNPRRYERFVLALNELCISKDAIQLATSATDARHYLSKVKYDFMIIDILIPLRPEEAPDERHSRELLTELVETEELLKPRHIVGLSGYRDAADRIAPFFRERVWTVVEYNEQTDDWISQIVNCVDYVKAEIEAPCRSDYNVDVAVICALGDPELKAVLALPWSWGAARPIDDVTFVYDGKLPGSTETPISVIAAATTRMGMVSTALLSSKLIGVFRPRLLVMPGICAGVRGKVNLGDVVLGDPTWDYQSGKRTEGTEGGAFAISPHQLSVHPAIRSRFEQLRIDRKLLSSISDRWNGVVEHPLKLVIGPIASGSAVLADGRAMGEVRNQHRELCGIEMEAYGLYSAATSAAAPRPFVFALKSVCDFGDADKDDTMQRYAAYTSAEVLSAFLAQHFHELKDPL